MNVLLNFLKTITNLYNYIISPITFIHTTQIIKIKGTVLVHPYSGDGYGEVHKERTSADDREAEVMIAST